MKPTPRYDRKPLLRLLELYVLSCIDAIPEDERAVLAQITPKLQKIHKLSGNWDEIISTIAGASADTPAAIRQIWAKNTEIAQQHGAELTPQQFAEMFVDQNFAG